MTAEEERAAIVAKERRRPGWFVERPKGPNSRRWHVVFREDGSAICNSEDGYYTAASAGTFAAWGWTEEGDHLTKEKEQ